MMAIPSPQIPARMAHQAHAGPHAAAMDSPGIPMAVASSVMMVTPSSPIPVPTAQADHVALRAAAMDSSGVQMEEQSSVMMQIPIIPIVASTHARTHVVAMASISQKEGMACRGHPMMKPVTRQHSTAHPITATVPAPARLPQSAAITLRNHQPSSAMMEMPITVIPVLMVPVVYARPHAAAMDSPGIPMAVRKFVMMRTHRIPMRVPQHAAPLPAVMDSPSQTVQIILQAQAMMSSVIVVPITLPIRIAAAPVANFPGAAISSLILCSTRVVMMDHRMACRSNAMHSVMESLLHSVATV